MNRTLHGSELAWLELMLSGAYPRGFGSPRSLTAASTARRPVAPVLTVLSVETGNVAPGDVIGLLDPEGVRLAELTIESVESVDPVDAVDAVGAVGPGPMGKVRVSGVPVASTPFSHADYPDLRAMPDSVSSGWDPGPAVAVWGDPPLTWAVREAARRQARELGLPLLEVVPLPSGRDTDTVAHLPARLARVETTRDQGDRAVVVPDPGLRWQPDEILVRASVVAEYGVTTLLVPPGRLSGLGARREAVVASASALGVSLTEVAAHAGETRLDPRVIDRLVLNGQDFPDWFAEPPVAEELRRLHRPRVQGGFTVLLSGLSGSGKSTVARHLAVRLLEHDNRSVSLLDGDVVRHHLSKGLGFSRDDRVTNVRRIGFVASEITKAGGIAVACPIAPYDATRKDVRAMVETHGGFVLVHISTPLDECERRDRKGLYAKARRGEIPEFTGISDPYEEPVDAEVVVDTTHITVDNAVDEVMAALRRLGYLPGDPTALQPQIPPYAVPR
ncbi:MAG: adenylyl-sulfate kinase [Actinomycetes bacterium]